MEWDTLEHAHIERTNDWYASIIIVAGALIAVAFLFNNFLLITLIFVATFALILVSARKPEMLHVEIRKTGIREGNAFHPYRSLDGFHVAEYPNEYRLLLESNRRLMPLIVIPMSEDIDPEELHETLEQYIPEKELHESLPHLIMERLGF